MLNTNRLFMLLMDVDRRPDFRRDRPLPWDGTGLIPRPPLLLSGGAKAVLSFLMLPPVGPAPAFSCPWYHVQLRK